MVIDPVGKQGASIPAWMGQTLLCALSPLCQLHRAAPKRGTECRNVTCWCANLCVTQQCQGLLSNDRLLCVSKYFFFFFFKSFNYLLFSIDPVLFQKLDSSLASQQRQKRKHLESQVLCTPAATSAGLVFCLTVGLGLLIVLFFFQGCDFTACQDLMSSSLLCKPLVDS